jgi:hypothetical protein
MAKLDLKKEHRRLYNPSSKKNSIVDVPEMQFLMIDGAGDPNTSVDYAEAIEALYAMAYTLKFISKTTEDVDYVVMPLEGLWWTPDMAEFSMDDKSAWEWTAMIVQPDHIIAAHFAAATDEVRKKKEPPALDRIRYEPYAEGLACTSSPPTAGTNSAANTTRSTSAIRDGRPRKGFGPSSDSRSSYVPRS